MDQELPDQRVCLETVIGSSNQHERNGSCLAGRVESDAGRVLPDSGLDTCERGDARNSEPNDSNLISGQTKVVEARNNDVPEDVDKHSCVIDIRCRAGVGESKDGEMVCRICHLNSDQGDANTNTNAELILLGCGCKDDLGIAHGHCAEAWFKLKGNRLCEICGETAKNVTGVVDNRFIEEWNENRGAGSSGDSSDRGRSCWCGQPFCNFLMACLVIAFVMPWFFRVNMF